MKKVISFLITLTMLFGIAVPVYANNDVKIKVDGKELTDAQAILQDGTTLLPVRSVSTALGGEVLWDNATKSVTVLKDKKIITAIIGEKFILVNGSAVNVSTPAQVIDGRTYIPLRVMGEALDCGITWVNETKTVEISNTTVPTTIADNRDLFNDKNDVPYFLTDGVYLTEGEVVPVPVVGGNWVEWSNKTIVDCEWSFYNNQQVILITGLKNGTCSLKIYESSSRAGLIENDYTEIKVHVVNPSSTKYMEQKAERIAAGFDILANQSDFIAAEEYIKDKYALTLEGVKDVTYIEKDGVLIIPILSSKELTGTFYLVAKESANLQAVMDEYNGKPAIFIKGTELTSANVLLRYINDTDGLEFKYITEEYEPNLLWDRESIRTDIELNKAETASWAFRIRVVNGNNSELKAQEKERLEKGISYDLYLNGQA